MTQFWVGVFVGASGLVTLVVAVALIADAICVWEDRKAREHNRTVGGP